MLPEPRPVALSTGVTLGVVDVGPRDAPALIFLHGFPESHRTWRHQIAHLKDRYRCIAPDQRGYRGSSKPADIAAYAPDRLTADVFALADAIGVERFAVAGHDWGGAVAWSVALNGQPGARAAAWAGRVTRAIIANAPHPYLFQRLLINDPAQRAASQYVRAFRDPASDAIVRQGGLTRLLASVVRWDRPLAMEAAERDALLADWACPDTAIAMLNWYRAAPIVVPAIDEAAAMPAFAAGSFPRLALPTLVVWGMDDGALSPANLDGLEALVEPLTIVRVAGSGHFVPWEAPDAVNAAIDAFM